MTQFFDFFVFDANRPELSEMSPLQRRLLGSLFWKIFWYFTVCSLCYIFHVLFSHFIGFSIFYGRRCFEKTTFIGNRPFAQSSSITRPCTTELAFTGLLFGLSAIEFFVALLASMYSSQFACCGKEGCCQSSKKGNFSCIIKIWYVMK